MNSPDVDLIEVVQRLSVVETFIQTMKENDLPHIHSELLWIRERLNRGYRPTWGVVALVTFLTSLSVGLLVTLVRGG